MSDSKRRSAIRYAAILSIAMLSAVLTGSGAGVVQVAKYSGCWGDGGDHTDAQGLCHGSRYCHVYAGGDVVWDGRARGYLRPGNSWFICQVRWPGHDNPSVGDARNDWWLYTQADTRYCDDPNQGWGWFPATKVSGGGDWEPIPGLPYCDSIPHFPSVAP